MIRDQDAQLVIKTEGFPGQPYSLGKTPHREKYCLWTSISHHSLSIHLALWAESRGIN